MNGIHPDEDFWRDFANTGPGSSFSREFEPHWLVFIQDMFSRIPEETDSEYRARVERETLRQRLDVVLLYNRRIRNSLQPVQRLPKEITEEIFLTARDRWIEEKEENTPVRSLVVDIQWIQASCHVCHGWREIAMSLAALWNIINGSLYSFEWVYQMLVRSRTFQISVSTVQSFIADYTYYISRRDKNRVKLFSLAISNQLSPALHSLVAYSNQLQAVRFGDRSNQVFPLLTVLRIRRHANQTHLLTLEDVRSSCRLPSLRRLYLDNCFAPTRAIHKLFPSLTELHINIGCQWIYCPLTSEISLDSLLASLLRVERLILADAFPWPIKPPESSNIIFPPSLRFLKLSFNVRTRFYLPILSKIDLKTPVDLNIEANVREYWSRPSCALIGSARPPRRLKFSISDNMRIRLYGSLYAIVEYTCGIQDHENTKDVKTAIKLQVVPKAQNPLDYIPLADVEAIIISIPYHLRCPYALSALRWEKVFKKARNVKELQIPVDKLWFTPILAALSVGQKRGQHDDEPVFPLLERLVFSGPIKHFEDGLETTPLGPVNNIRKLDAIRRCLLSRSQAGYPVHSLSLPPRFQGADWAEDLRYHVEKLSFGDEVALEV